MQPPQTHKTTHPKAKPKYAPQWDSQHAPQWCPSPTFHAGATARPMPATNTVLNEGCPSLEVHGVGGRVVVVCGSRGRDLAWSPLWGGLGHKIGQSFGLACEWFHAPVGGCGALRLGRRLSCRHSSVVSARGAGKSVARAHRRTCRKPVHRRLHRNACQKAASSGTLSGSFILKSHDEKRTR